MKRLFGFDIVKQFENIYSWIILILVFSLYYLDFVPNDNEENYLQLAKAFYDHNWMNNSFVLSESGGTRTLYQYIIGFFLKLFSFELVIFIFRGLFIIAYSFILHKIYKSLKITNLMILVHLVFMYLDKQSYFAGSWIFITIEAKAFAYLFVLLALNFIIQRKYNQTILFLIFATYFHILIGFYAFVYMALTILIIEKWDFKSNFKLIFKMSVYFVSILPFVIFLNTNLDAQIDLKPSSDWIYSYFRNPHHTTLSDGFAIHLKGIVFSFIAMLSLVYMIKKDQNDKMQVLYILGIVSYAGTLLLVPLIFIDENGTFLKFYLFRINAFSTFIFTLLLTKWLFKVIRSNHLRLVYAGIIIIASMQLLEVGFRNYRKIKSYEDFSLNEVSDFIKSETNENAIILGLKYSEGAIQDSWGDLNLSLMRRMERDMFVVFKFVPTDLSKIHEWYKRIKIRENIIKDINNLVTISKKYKIDYVLSRKKIDKEFLKLEFNNDNYYLYKVMIY